MLACEADLNKIQYPVLANQKLDGIRAIVHGGKLLSRTLKPIPNKAIYNLLSDFQLEGFDGELICLPATSEDVYRRTNSFVMSENPEQNERWVYYVFDDFSVKDLPYVERVQRIMERTDYLKRELSVRVQWLNYVRINDQDELIRNLHRCEELGYEGLMIRDPNGIYKFNRSTQREGYLQKLKTFSDSEAVIIEVIQEMENTNEAKTNELGRTERSIKKEGLVPKESMGSLLVRDYTTGVEFNIGTGFTKEDREYFWNNRYNLTGKLIKYKYFPVGNKDKPRFPVYLGFRSLDDL
jgi:DNA ligase-1